MKRLLLFVLAMAVASPAFAQYQAPTNNGNIVVTTCGTVPSDYPAVNATTPNRGPNVVDANGNLCTTPSSTGTDNVNITKVGGTSVSTAALPVFPAITTGFTTLYNGTGATVTTLSATSGTVITALTLLINTIHCFNITSGAITVSRTNTAGTQQEVTYSIPANSNLVLEPPGSWVQTVGLKLWASAVSSITCEISGLTP